MTTLNSIPYTELNYENLLKWCDFLLGNINNSQERFSLACTNTLENIRHTSQLPAGSIRDLIDEQLGSGSDAFCISCKRTSTPNGSRLFSIKWVYQDPQGLRTTYKTKETGFYEREQLMRVVSNFMHKHNVRVRAEQRGVLVRVKPH